MANEQDLLKQIASLREQLGLANKAKDEAQEMAKSMAEASAFMGSTSEEQATGNTVKLRMCVNPGERDEKKHKFKDVEYPTYFYTIDLPEGAGTDLTTNGVAYYHGQTYEVDPMALADLKSRVARTWDHERAIHSENANAYRKPTNVHLKSAAAIQRGM